MAFTDTTRKQEASGSSVVTLNTLVHTGSVAGNLLIVVTTSIRSGTDVSNPTITDDKANTWTKETTNWITGTGLAVGVSWTIVAAGKDGDLTITTSPNGVNSFDITYYSHEFTGPHATPVSGTNVTNTNTGTTVDTNAMTPADSDALVIAAFAGNGSSTVLQNVAPGDTDWTLSNENEAAGSPCGSLVYFIETGAAVARRAAWTLGTSRVWASYIMAFKPVAAEATVTWVGYIG